MAKVQEAKLIWMDGKLIPWEDAKIHVLTHSLHYGNAVFEGVRVYQTKKGSAIFRLAEHTRRLFDSAKSCLIDIPFSYDELIKGQIDVVRENHFTDTAYLRPLAWFGYGHMGVSAKDAPVNVALVAWQWGAYMGADALANGIKVKTSSWYKNAPSSMMSGAKASANYFNSQMANHDAITSGYDEALLLDQNGFVAEGSGECFFIVRDGVIITPENDTNLKSITQATVIEMAQDLGYEVKRKRIAREEAYCADEAFFTGTAAEVTPITNIDGRIIGTGKMGQITSHLQKVYFAAVRGENSKYEHYLTYCN